MTTNDPNKWLETLRAAEASGIDAKKLGERVARLVNDQLHAGDTETVRRVLDWAAGRVDFFSLLGTFETIWRIYADKQWQIGAFDRIWKVFASLDDGPKPGHSAGADAPGVLDRDDSRSPLPPFLMQFGDAMETRPPGEATILFMMNERTIRKEEGRLVLAQPEDMTYHYRASAKLAGHRVHYIDSSRFSYDFGSHEGLEHLLEVDDAIDHAINIKPDVVVFDGNYIPRNFGLTKARLARLRAATGARMIATVGDNHGPSAAKRCSYWTSNCDLVISFEPSVIHAPEVQRKIQLMFIPIEVQRPDVPRDEQRVYYSGSPRGDRIAYIAMMRDRGIPLTANIASRNAPNNFEYADYLRNLASHGFAINSGRRSTFPIGDTPPINIITGRAHEVIKLGAVLLQRSGSRLSDFLTPGEHYIEFDNVENLAENIEFLSRNQEARRRIARQAETFARRYYAGPKFWNLVLHALGNVPNR